MSVVLILNYIVLPTLYPTSEPTYAPTFVASYNDSTYIGVYAGSSPMNWIQALEYCQYNFRSSLASIHSSMDEINVVSAIRSVLTQTNNENLADSVNSWIGLIYNSTDAGDTNASWSWADKTSVNYTATHYNQSINTAIDTPSCALIAGLTVNSSEKWNITSCSNVAEVFVCNSPPLHSGAFISASFTANYTNAESYCLSEYGSNLATIFNEQENEYVRSAASNGAGIASTNSLWIGLNDIKQFGKYTTKREGDWDYWNDGTYGGNLRYTNWYGNNPDNAGTGQNCGAIYFVEGGDPWVDDFCDTQQYFVCNCDLYIPIHVKMSWTQANDYCRTTYGTNLAIIHDSMENECVKHLIGQVSITDAQNNGDEVTYNQSMWIGVKWNGKISEWTLPSGKPLTSMSGGGFTNWAPVGGEPNSYVNENDTCVGIRSNGWYDDVCNLTQYFACDNPRNPTLMPTRIPTSEPSQFPTMEPTNEPTENPTDMPTQDPITDAPTNYPLTTTTYKIGESLSSASKLISRWNDTGTYVLIGGLSIGSIICLSALYVWITSKKKGDNMNFLSIFRFIFQTLDLWTDMSFCIVLYIKNKKELFLSSLLFLMIPYLMSCCVSIYWIIVWNNWKYDHPHRLKNYLKSYEILILLLSVFGGFYSTVDLLRSKLFYLKVTYLPLKQSEYDKLQYLRFINFVLMENIPQFFIQIWYLFVDNADEDELLPIVLAALFMTVVGLLFGILKIVKKGMEEQCVYSCISCMNRMKGNNIIDDRNRLMKLREDYNAKTKISCQFMIQCAKPDKFCKAHGFCHKKMGSSLKMVLDTCKDKKYWYGRNNVFYSIECYHIESQYHLNRLTTFFELNLFTKFSDIKYNERNVSRAASIGSVSSIDSGFGINNMNGNSIGVASNSHSRAPSMPDIFGDMGIGGASMALDIGDDVKVEVANENLISKHDKLVSKLKENLINMLDLPNGVQKANNNQNNSVVKDIANDWVSSMLKMFRMPDTAIITILFDKNSDINIETTKFNDLDSKQSNCDDVEKDGVNDDDVDAAGLPQSSPIVTSKVSEIVGEINQEQWLSALAVSVSNPNQENPGHLAIAAPVDEPATIGQNTLNEGNDNGDDSMDEVIDDEYDMYTAGDINIGQIKANDKECGESGISGMSGASTPVGDNESVVNVYVGDFDQTDKDQKGEDDGRDNESSSSTWRQALPMHTK